MRLGIFGLGRAGIRHAQNAVILGHKVSAYDPVITRRHDFPSGLAIVKTRNEVLTASDAVIIATPSEQHLDDLTACLAAGKHVLVEKPIGLIRQRKDIQHLVQLNTANGNHLTIAIGCNLRFHPAIVNAREVIATETAAGRPPFYASFTCCQYTESRDALTNGCLEVWAIHEIDLAEHLCGPLRLIDHHGDHTTVNLGLARWEGPPCFVVVHSDMRARGHLRQIVICTESLTQRIDLEANPVTDEHYRWELEAFVNRIHGDDDDTLASGEDGVAALRIAERASPDGMGPKPPAPSGNPRQQ